MREKQVILVVDDQPVNRKILQRLLSDSYVVLEAENGAVAWEILNRGDEKICAVLLDVVMPVMNGYQFLEKVRETHLTELPIIVMTGESDEEAEQKALDAGAWDFVTKPYNARVLQSRLKNAVARSQVSVYEKLQHMSEHDPLTGLHNRGKMFKNTRKLLDANKKERFVFLRMDLDRFALFNTSFGEAEGDKLLKYMAKILTRMAEQYRLRTYGRMNADVYCACLPYDGDQEKLREQIESMQQELACYRADYLLEMSVGACEVLDPSLSVEELFFRASMAAARCKNQYEVHLEFYDEAVGKKVAVETTITNEMQTALDEEQFVVYYQPKFRLSTDSACGAEALVRWKHPVKGLIPPGDFIPVFESNGFVAKVDYYVWEKVCQSLKRWCDAGFLPFPVSVNISRISLYNPKLVSLLVGLVEKYQIQPALLQLEVTESAYMTNPDLMEGTIHDLRSAGFTLLMDDFGSGYSSLNTLKRIEMDILKIDMKFLPVKEETEKGEIILASMIKMANWLGMSVVVEGVETRRQRDFLEGTGCDCVQGYYYSRPIPEEEYEHHYVFNRTEADSACSEEQETGLIPKHNVTILVIDDVEVDRVILKEYFKDHYHVHTCENAEEGLAYLRRNLSKVRLILIDNVMPGMSGLDFLTYCQSSTNLHAIPQIMITANDRVEDQVRAFQSGAYDYITKPLVKEIVIARVNHVMEISRQTSLFDSMEQDYKYQSERDHATGLLNKTAFREASTHMMECCPTDQKALMVIDIDNFKQVNDRYGHLVGDQIINTVASELTDIFRRMDITGRFGGDEFVVLMSGIQNQEMVKRKAQDVIKAVVFAAAKLHHMEVSISVGLSFSEQTDTIDTLFARADQALYEAKSTGKGKVVVYGEKVPPIQDDNKPVVLICGEDPQLYPAIALSYGDSAAFANVTSFQELKNAFDSYRGRIRTVCLDMQKQAMEDSDAFYEYLLAQGCGESIPVVAICQDGNMTQLRAALMLKVEDVVTIPPQMDVIQRRLSRSIMAGAVRQR